MRRSWRYRIILISLLFSFFVLNGCSRAADRLRGVRDTCACHGD